MNKICMADIPFVGPYRAINNKTHELIEDSPDAMPDVCMAEVTAVYVGDDGVLVFELNW